MGGGKGGGSKSISVPNVTAPTIANNEWTDELADMAKRTYGQASNLWNQTQPARDWFAEDWKSFLRPDQGQAYDPYKLPAFQPLYGLARTGLEDQYGVAKENILSGLPRGGAMGRALGNLETGRAKDVGSLQASISAPIIQDLYNKAYGTAWTTAPAQAFAGYGSAMTGMGGAAGYENAQNISQAGLINNAAIASQQAQLAAQVQEAQASRAGSTTKGAGMGSMLGKGLGSMIPGIGTAIGGAIGGGLGNIGSSIGSSLGKGSQGITSGLGGYTALANQANPAMW